jgi:SAM-dependent methyltransferase
MKQREIWDARYRERGATPPAAAQVLRDFSHLLPQTGTALDLAAGLGGNALLLAGRGLATSAWDLSPVAVQRLAATAVENALSIDCEVRDVLAEPPPARHFDIIVVSRFLERSLCPRLADALRPGGLLFYQTFTRERCDRSTGPANPMFLLERGELLRLFPTLQPVAYREEGLLGQLTQGLRNEAYLVAQRPQ